jgi:anti-anti-sigma factor
MDRMAKPVNGGIPSAARRCTFPYIVDFDPQPAVLRCRGDEDRATQSLRRPAFSRALTSARDVVVDLSELSFADSSLILDLAALARRLRMAGAHLRLRGAQPHIQRLIELVGLDRLPGVVLEPVL